MAIQAGAGSKIYIADETTTQTTAAGYDGLTWTEIEQTEAIGSFGDSTNVVTFTGLGDARVQKLKGSADAGTLNIVMGFKKDAFGSPLGGQGKLLAAADDTTDTNYNFKIELNDAGTGSPQNPSTRYFAGQVGTFVEGVPGADDIVRVESEVRINTVITRKTAT